MASHFVSCFHFFPLNDAPQHLFTDGACCQAEQPCLNLASFGVLSATSDEMVGLGHLSGITQSIDRAELFALVKATSWTTTHDLYICSDSLSNVHIAEHIQQHGWIPSHVENYDLWLLLQDALGLRQGYHSLPLGAIPCTHLSSGGSL